MFPLLIIYSIILTVWRLVMYNFGKRFKEIREEKI